MSKKLNLFGLMLAALVSIQASSAVPSGYYTGAQGKSNQALKTALHKIIKGHTKRSYQNLWTDFKTTDCNGNIIIDRYSTTQFTYNTNQCGTYSGVGDCYNREHSIPNSWWGGLSSDTAYTDLHHMFPVDGWVNSERGNHPFGDCANGSARGTGKLGSCTFSGYSGTVFEVADEYKGDFARVYFYFATRYMMRMSDYTSGTGSVVFTSSSYLGLTTWAINQLLEWHRNDPVSTLETRRNDAVYGIQHNRNPFVDYPELVEYIWGNKKGSTWTPGGVTPTPTPVLTSPASGSTVDVGTNTGSGVTKTITVRGSDLTKALTVSVSGNGFTVSPTSITATNANNGTTVTVTYNGTSANATGTLTITSTELTTTTVNLTASYNAGGSVEPGEEIVETWEGISTYQSYATTFIQGHAFKWNTSDVGIWNTDTHKNDTQSVRFGKTSSSYIAMAEDVADGACKISFYAANWSSSEAAPTLLVQYSTNGGSTWTNVGTCSPNATWQQYSFDLNVTGNVRFKIAQTAGARLNIDDIAITANNSAPAPNPTITINALDMIEAEQGGESTIVSGAVTADNNDENITLTVSGNFQISLNRMSWSTTLTLDPMGEVFYVRMANTAVSGEFEGTIQAKTSMVSAYADVEGIVNEKAVLMGDVNCDGSVTIADVTELIDYLLSGSVVGAFDEVAADLNQDGSITISDVTQMIDVLLSGGQASMTARAWNAVPATGGIQVENPTDEALEVYNLDGDCVMIITTGDVKVDLPAGTYIVSGDSTSRKVVVK